MAAGLMLMTPTLWTAADDPTASSSVALTFSLTDIIDRLNGSRWMLELRPLFSQEDQEPAQDLLTFEQQLVTSQLLTPDGFMPARFTVTMSEGAAPVWEALQSSPTAGVAIWRGELHGEEMRGTVSKQPIEGNSQDYLFVGHLMHGSETPTPVHNEEDSEPTP